MNVIEASQHQVMRLGHRQLQLPAPDKVQPWIWRSYRRLSGLDHLVDLYQELPESLGSGEFAAAALNVLGVTHEADAAELREIPLAGSVVIVANHPFGGIDGLAAIATLHGRRSDLKVLATTTLGALPDLAELLITVDNFGNKSGRGKNVSALRCALRHLKQGGALLIFPAGEVSSLQLSKGCIVDPPWKISAINLFKLARAPIVPMYLEGGNGIGFQVAGLVHPLIRTALLPREVANKRGTHLRMRLGKCISADTLHALADPARIARFLRVRLYALATVRPATRLAMSPASPRCHTAIAPAIDPMELGAEIARLPSTALLTRVGHLAVYCAAASSLPKVLQEIGRLREVTFRAVGEGTGEPIDLDQFDRDYEHLFAWDERKQCLVGAYRLGRLDQIRRLRGKNAFYLATLFDFNDAFFMLSGPVLELGRSFVRLEYQRSFTPLLALWRGIGEYVSRHPRYSKLMGPVSVSASLGASTHQLIARYLKAQHFDAVAATLVKARTPLRRASALATVERELTEINSLDELAMVLPEADGKLGVPVLLRQYLKLGGRVIGFNIDPGFGDCLDCLTIVDLGRTPDDVLSKYMTADALQRFRARQPRRMSSAA